MATFNKGQELATDLTSQEMQNLWKLILESYRTAQKEINNSIAQVYAKILSGIAPEDYYNTMIQFDRLGKLSKQVSDQYLFASRKAGVLTAASSELAITNTFYREQFVLDFFTSGGELSFSYLNPRIIQASVFGTEKLWRGIQSEAIQKVYGTAGQYFPRRGSLTSLLVRNRSKELTAIQQTLTTGFITGSSYREMTDDISNIIGKELVKKVTVKNVAITKKVLTGAKASASLIVRTEGTRNLNAGFQAMLKTADFQGLEMQKEWIATLDILTRGSHQSADTQTVDLDSNFTVNGATGQFPGQLNSAGENANCRCSHIGVTPEIQPDLRRGRNPVTGENEVFTFRSFNTWAEEHNLSTNKAGVLKIIDKK